MESRFYSTIRTVGLGMILVSLGWAVYSGLSGEKVPGVRAFKDAESEFASGKYAAALTRYDESLQQSPDFVAAIHARGRTLMFLERFEDALADFDKALAKDPEFAVSYANRGILKDRMGHYEEALQDYRQAMKLEPDLAAEPNWITRLLKQPSENTPTIADRAGYLQKQLSLPREQRQLPFPKNDGDRS